MPKQLNFGEQVTQSLRRLGNVKLRQTTGHSLLTRLKSNGNSQMASGGDNVEMMIVNYHPVGQVFGT